MLSLKRWCDSKHPFSNSMDPNAGSKFTISPGISKTYGEHPLPRKKHQKPIEFFFKKTPNMWKHLRKTSVVSPTFTLDTNRLRTFSVLPRVSTWKLGIPRIWQAIQVRFRQVLNLLQVNSGSKTTFNIKRDRHHIIPTSVQKNRILYTTILRKFFKKLWTEFETFKGGFCYLFHPFFQKNLLLTVLRHAAEPHEFHWKKSPESSAKKGPTTICRVPRKFL